MLSPEAQAIVERMKMMKALRRTSSIEEMRQRQKDNPIAKLPEDAVKETFTVKQVECEKVSLPASDPSSALLYIHGGGFKNGYAANGYHLGCSIARLTGQTFYGVNYRLAPEYTYPTAMMDVVNTWKWMIGNGIKPERSAFIGTSAGGTLVMAAALWCRDHGIPLPSTLVVNSPYIGEGLVPTREEIEGDVILDYNPGSSLEYFSTADCDDPYAYVKYARFSGLPFTALYAARKEILAQHSIELDRLLTRDGVEHCFKMDEELWHAALNAPVPENEKYYKEIASLIKAHFPV